MSAGFVMPDGSDVKGLLEMLFGRDVEVKPAAADELGRGRFTAFYEDDAGDPAAVVACDTPFAAFAGGALSLIPAGGAKDAAKSGELPEMMVANLHEVMNVFSRLLMDNTSPHLKLIDVYEDGGDLPAGATSILGGAEAQAAGFDVSILDYGSGRVALHAR